MTADLTPAKTSAASVAAVGGTKWFPVGTLAVGFAGCGVFLANRMTAVGFLLLGHMIFFLMMFWLLGTPRPLKAGEARPPVASSFRSLSGSALLALVAAAALACCAQAGHPPGWFPMMK